MFCEYKIVILVEPALVAAEAVIVNLISVVPTSDQANAPPASVVGYFLPTPVPSAKVLIILVAPPATSPTLKLVAPEAATTESSTQSIICEFAGITIFVTSAASAPLDAA